MESIYYTVKVVALLWILMVACIVMFGANPSVKNDRLSQVFMAVTLSTVLPILGYAVEAGWNAPGTIPWAFPAVSYVAVSYVGFLIFFLGLTLHWTGIRTLDKQWSAVVVIRKDHKLVDSGIYHYIRHPIYAALLLEILGLGLAPGAPDSERNKSGLSNPCRRRCVGKAFWRGLCKLCSQNQALDPGNFVGKPPLVSRKQESFVRLRWLQETIAEQSIQLGTWRNETYT